ncbi:hypothetical protein [Spongiactinospora sp. 9N601]|uniref:hypothetical protein n=1 Tax=Spongiactinospora sp. 9N601 TaxID=3375149 RepID=UPI0037A6074C
MSADETFGIRLRKLREAPPYWSRSDLARRIRDAAHPDDDIPHVPSLVSSIKQWESEIHMPGRKYRPLLARALGVSEGELFGDSPPMALETSMPEASGLPWVWEPGAVSRAIHEATMHDLTLDRRQATKALTVVVGLPLIDPVQRRLTAFSPVLPHHAARSRIGMDEIARLETAAEHFRTWDHSSGGGLARKAVIGQLNDVADLIKDIHPHQITRRLYGVMARLAKTAANMSWDSGMQQMAQRYYVLALQAGRVADDRGFGAGVLASMARQLLYLKKPGDALELVRLALDGTRASGAERVRAMLHTREAWAYAGLGRIEAFRRATAAAEDAYAASGGDDPDWHTSFDEAELAGVTGGRYLDLALANPHFAPEAVSHIKRAIELRAQRFRRSFALDYAGLAHAYVINGELDAAVIMAETAISASGQVASGRVHAQLQDLTQVLADQKAPGVAELRTRLQATLTSKAPR